MKKLILGVCIFPIFSYGMENKITKQNKMKANTNLSIKQLTEFINMKADNSSEEISVLKNENVTLQEEIKHLTNSQKKEVVEFNFEEHLHEEIRKKYFNWIKNGNDFQCYSGAFVVVNRSDGTWTLGQIVAVNVDNNPLEVMVILSNPNSENETVKTKRLSFLELGILKKHYEVKIPEIKKITENSDAFENVSENGSPIFN